MGREGEEGRKGGPRLDAGVLKVLLCTGLGYGYVEGVAE